MNVPSKKTVFLRIGSDKAGTVTLAELVRWNADLFMAKGCFTPMVNSSTLIDYAIYCAQKGVPCLPQDVSVYSKSDLWLNSTRSQETIDQFLDFAKAYETTSNSDIFLLTETLWGQWVNKDPKLFGCDPSEVMNNINSFLFNHEIKIVVNIRRVDLYIESIFNQSVKRGDCVNKSRIMRMASGRSSQRALDFVMKLEKCFGRENIIFRPFEREQMVDRDFISDTLHMLGLHEFRDEFRVGQLNAGLQRDLLETLIPLNETHGKILTNYDLLKVSAILKEKYKYKEVREILSQEERILLIEESAEFYSYLSENYLETAPVFKNPLPDDAHMGYKLTDERREFISNMIFHIKDHGFKNLPEASPDQ